MSMIEELKMVREAIELVNRNITVFDGVLQKVIPTSLAKITTIIEQMEKAEPIPVGHFKKVFGKWIQLDTDCWPSGSEDSTPLYTAAPAAVENLWQPIETAPECKSVLACNSAGYIGRAIFVKGKWEHIGNPTHWMPLPNPPAMKGEK